MSERGTVTETRDVEGFHSVRLSGLSTVTVTQGDHTALTIEATADLMSRVTSEVEDGVLVLGIRRNGWLQGLKQKKLSIRFGVTMDRVRGLSLSGAGRINAPSIETDSLSLVVSGAGAIEVSALKAESLSVVLSGAGDCEVAGKVTSQSIKLSGVGSYSAADLESETANAVLSGAGNIKIHVRETLDATVSGAGSVRYHGAPTVRQRVTGVGRIMCTASE